MHAYTVVMRIVKINITELDIALNILKIINVFVNMTVLVRRICPIMFNLEYAIIRK